MAITNPLNSEAGQVPVPSDPKEIAAAVRANRIMFRAFPYLGWRYGDRGKRFGDSDSAYFLTLLGYDQATMNKQIDWMAGLLAARGMPTFILEMHLRTLARVLTRTSPGADRGGTLARAAARLRDIRSARLTDDEIKELGARFAERAGFPHHPRVIGTGVLLAGAVADELNGQKLAVESLEGWITDKAVFPRPWIEAVRAAVRAARRIASAKIQ